jgi:ABC-type multidrug transport system fused ATPase/permease subunit
LIVGGTNIKEIELNSLRKQIGFVSQEPTLFSGSLRENI